MRSARPAVVHRGFVRGRAWLHVGVGMLVGVLYAWLDDAFDARLLNGAMDGLLASAHAVVDRVLPVVTGALFGLVTSQLGVRARLAEGERTRAESLRMRLERVERDQAVWVMAASVLHEVRNPLHTLGLLVDELAAGDDAPKLLADARVQMDRIAAHLEALRALPSTGRPEVASTDVLRIAFEIARDLEDVAKAGAIGLTVRAAEPVRALGDATYLRVILENLIANSIQVLRSANAAGHIAVDVVREAGSAVIRVTDDGPGVAAEVERTLFEPLRTTRAGDREGVGRGMGLGLPIARALARAMDGDVVFEGGAFGGTSFRVQLPVAS